MNTRADRTPLGEVRGRLIGERGKNAVAQLWHFVQALANVAETSAAGLRETRLHARGDGQRASQRGHIPRPGTGKADPREQALQVENGGEFLDDFGAKNRTRVQLFYRIEPRCDFR